MLLSSCCNGCIRTLLLSPHSSSGNSRLYLKVETAADCMTAVTPWGKVCRCDSYSSHWLMLDVIYEGFSEVIHCQLYMFWSAQRGVMVPEESPQGCWDRCMWNWWGVRGSHTQYPSSAPSEWGPMDRGEKLNNDVLFWEACGAQNSRMIM